MGAMKRFTLYLTFFMAGMMLIGCNLSQVEPTPTFAPTPLPPTFDPNATLSSDNVATPIILTGEDGSACRVPDGWLAYIVESGDSLSLLGEQTQTLPGDLAEANCLADEDSLFVGEVIYVPRQPIVSP